MPFNTVSYLIFGCFYIFQCFGLGFSWLVFISEGVFNQRKVVAVFKKKTDRFRSGANEAFSICLDLCQGSLRHHIDLNTSRQYLGEHEQFKFTTPLTINWHILHIAIKVTWYSLGGNHRSKLSISQKIELSWVVFAGILMGHTHNPLGQKNLEKGLKKGKFPAASTKQTKISDLVIPWDVPPPNNNMKLYI